MKKLSLLLICSFAIFNSYAQDVLTKKDGTQLTGQVTEQQDGFIKVQNGNDVEYVSKGDVKSIHYSSTSQQSNSGSENSSNSKSSSQSIEKKPCETNQTGSFCLNNTSSVPIRVTLNYKSGVNPSQPDNWQTVTIDANSSQCFYDLPAGSHSFNANRNADQFNTVKSGSFFQGQINVVACQEGKKDIK